MNARIAIDQPLLDQTRADLQAILEKFSALAQQRVAADQFSRQLLHSAVEALAAGGALLWRRQEDYWELEETFRIQAAEQPDAEPNLERFECVVESGRPASYRDDVDGLAQLQYLCPLKVYGETWGLLEIVQYRRVSPAAVAGQLRFLHQLCATAAEFYQRKEWASIRENQQWLSHVAEFDQEIFSSLDLKTTSFAVANGVLTLTTAERASLVLGAARNAEVIAVSGQAGFKRRSPIVKQMRTLGRTLLKQKRGLLVGEAIDDSLQSKVEDYKNQVGCAEVIALPLVVDTKTHHRVTHQTIGMMLLEWYDNPLPEGWQARWDLVAQRSATAIANACKSEKRFGFATSIWGKFVSYLKWLMFLLVVGGIVAAMVALPLDYDIHVQGTLEPTEQRQVFARTPGEVAEVRVDHGQQVAAGEVLATLTNRDLHYRLQQLVDQRKQLEKRIEVLRAARLNRPRGGYNEQNDFASQQQAHQENLQGIIEQEGLLRKQLEDLEIVSPIAGQVVTWNAKDILLTRPVQIGQVLLTVANPHGDWELAVDVPEDRIGTLISTQQEQNQPIRVTFRLATDPSEEYHGTLQEFAPRAEFDATQQNTVQSRVAFDTNQIPPELLRPGAKVLVKFHCGQRCAGAVIFADLFAFIQREVLFRL